MNLNNSIISRHYDDKLPLKRLNFIQNEYREKFNKYLKSGKLNYSKNNCICDRAGNDMLISNHDKHGIEITNLICINCGLIRQDPTLDEQSLGIFYKEIYRPLYLGKTSEENLKDIFLSQIKKGEVFYNFINQKVKISNYKSVLEIGCSAGGILKYFQSKGHVVTGFDFDANYIKYGKNNLLNLNFGGSNEIKNRGLKFDLIILSHVVEHFRDLGKEIKTIFEVLNDEGIIFIQVPGIFNKDYYKTSERCDFLFYIQNAHNYYFTKNTFLNLFYFLNINSSIVHIDEKINVIMKKSNKPNYKHENDYKKIINFIKNIEKKRPLLSNIYLIKEFIISFLRYILKKTYLHSFFKKHYLRYFEKK